MIGEADVRRAVDRIVALYDPDAVYVFGSYAKGELTGTSDLDLVVVKPTELPRWRRGRDVVAVLSELAFELDLLFVTPAELAEELADQYSLLATVMPGARPLYQRDG